jgi:hypothetical protein
MVACGLDVTRLHFGLDQAQVVYSLEVRWPSGQVDTFKVFR